MVRKRLCAMRSGGEETIGAIFLPKKMLLWVLEFIAVMPTSCIKLPEKHYKNMVIRFLHSLKGTLYFGTLLNQGGLPINYITNSGNMGNYSRFLKELVSELSLINIDWNEVDSSIIQQFNCISYLGKAFKNENISDVSMQIAHAVIVGEKDILPYDDTDASLAEIDQVNSETAYSRAKAQRKTRPLSLHWKATELWRMGKGILM